MLLSSPAERCRQTLQPFAEETGAELQQVGWLAEGEAAHTALEGLLAAASTSTRPFLVACTHGDVIWGMLAILERRRVPLQPGVAAPKASTWVLDLRDGEVVGARLLPPPVIDGYAG